RYLEDDAFKGYEEALNKLKVEPKAPAKPRASAPDQRKAGPKAPAAGAAPPKPAPAAPAVKEPPKPAPAPAPKKPANAPAVPFCPGAGGPPPPPSRGRHRGLPGRLRAPLGARPLARGADVGEHLGELRPAPEQPEEGGGRQPVDLAVPVGHHPAELEHLLELL